MLGNPPKEIAENMKKVENSLEITERFEAPNLPPLNDSQQRAIYSGLNNSFTMIQGPPGTGKTVTSATLAYNFSLKLPKDRIGDVERLGMLNPKVLVCAPSNAATDILALRINRTGAKAYRMYSKNKEGVPVDPELAKMSIHALKSSAKE